MKTSELIERVKNKDESAYKEAVVLYEKMIYSIINTYQLDYGDYTISTEDLYQEGLIGIYDACFAYDESKDTKFSTFVYIVIKRKIQRFYLSQLRKYVNESYSIDNVEHLDHYNEIKAECICENPIEYHKSERIKDQLRHFSKLDKKILLMRIERYSYKEIAEKLKVNEKRIDNRLYRIKKQIALEKENTDKEKI